MKKALTNIESGLEWIDGSKLCDLDYADDTALIETSRTGKQQQPHEQRHQEV